MNKTRLFHVLLITLTLGFQTGCAVLIGNVKPVDEKSENYGVMDLSKNSPDWVKLSSDSAQNKDDGLTPTEISDVAYQSKSTASIISLNSACRMGADEETRALGDLTNLLILGMTEITLRKERGIEVQSTPAQETTVQGKLNGEEMMIRTVVLKRNACVYDLVYLARPELFSKNENDFAQFVDSLRLK